jgi:hypothetical protein
MRFLIMQFSPAFCYFLSFMAHILLPAFFSQTPSSYRLDTNDLSGLKYLFYKTKRHTEMKLPPLEGKLLKFL